MDENISVVVDVVEFIVLKIICAVEMDYTRLIASDLDKHMIDAALRPIANVPFSNLYMDLSKCNFTTHKNITISFDEFFDTRFEAQSDSVHPFTIQEEVVQHNPAKAILFSEVTSTSINENKKQVLANTHNQENSKSKLSVEMIRSKSRTIVLFHRF